MPNTPGALETKGFTSSERNGQNEGWEEESKRETGFSPVLETEKKTEESLKAPVIDLGINQTPQEITQKVEEAGTISHSQNPEQARDAIAALLNNDHSSIDELISAAGLSDVENK